MRRRRGLWRWSEPKHGVSRRSGATIVSQSPKRMAYIRRMALDPALLEILVCPECKTPVRLVRDGAGLECGTCHRVYPVKDGIPVMLIDEAEAPTTGR